MDAPGLLSLAVGTALLSLCLTVLLTQYTPCGAQPDVIAVLVPGAEVEAFRKANPTAVTFQAVERMACPALTARQARELRRRHRRVARAAGAQGATVFYLLGSD